MDLVGGEQVAVLAVAETTFRAMELSEGIIDHSTDLPNFHPPPETICRRR
jgi:hypothetical protein